MSLKVILAYVHPTINLAKYQPLARRWVKTYQDNPPGAYPHEICVLVNGRKYPELEKIFDPLPVRYLFHSNVGRDIGAYQLTAQTVPCDLMVCLGSPVYFHKSGWLDWVMESYLANGPGVYGAFAFHQPAVHIRTTVFWMPPEILNAYPKQVGDGDRYGFEHGSDSLTLWAQRSGFPVLQVTWNGTFDVPKWHHVPRNEALVIDQHMTG